METKKKNLTLREYLVLQSTKRFANSSDLLKSNFFDNQEEKKFLKKVSNLQKYLRKIIHEDNAYLYVFNEVDEIKNMYMESMKLFQRETESSEQKIEDLPLVNSPSFKDDIFKKSSLKYL